MRVTSLTVFLVVFCYNDYVNALDRRSEFKRDFSNIRREYIPSLKDDVSNNKYWLSPPPIRKNYQPYLQSEMKWNGRINSPIRRSYNNRGNSRYAQRQSAINGPRTIRQQFDKNERLINREAKKSYPHVTYITQRVPHYAPTYNKNVYVRDVPFIVTPNNNLDKHLSNRYILY